MIFIYDLETTGLANRTSIDPAKQPGIVQFGAARLNNNFEVEMTLDLKINPELEYPELWQEDAQRISGITPEMVAGCPSFYSVFQRIADACLGCRYLTGYNIAGFDNEILAFNLARYGVGHNFPWPPVHIDMIDIASEAMGMQGKRGEKRPTLSEAYEKFVGKPLENSHDALADVMGTIEVLKAVGREWFL